MRKITNETERKCRKEASEKLRQAIRALKAAGDHGTAYQTEAILNRLDERRALENRAAGLSKNPRRVT